MQNWQKGWGYIFEKSSKITKSRNKNLENVLKFGHKCKGCDGKKVGEKVVINGVKS